MSPKANAYFFVIFAVGCAAIITHGFDFQTADPFRFAVYLVLALVASSLKVGLPGGPGTMSVLFLVVLIGITELTLSETLWIGAAAVFVQSFWRAKQRPKFIHVSFNLASLLIAIEAAHYIFRQPAIQPAPFPVRLAAATFTFWIGNTLTVSAVIALTEKAWVVETWRKYYSWTFPYYMVGGCLAGIFSSLTNRIGWQTSILFLPIVYLLYRSYRLYLERLEQGRLYAEQMQAAANRLNAVLESTTDLVFATDFKGKITYVNQRARTRLFGGNDPIDTVVWDAFPNLATGENSEQVRQAFETQSPVSIEEEFFPSSNAAFDLHAYPSPEGMAFYLKDVTEERVLADQLRQSQKMEAIGRLAGGVAHDFNNLLTIILGYGQVLAHTLEKDSMEAGAVTEILKAGDRAAALTQRLLAFSRRQVLQPVVLNLNTVVTGFESMLRRLIGEDIRISVPLDSTIGSIKADPNQIEQIVMNLAVNARDAMPEGGELTIRTYSTQVDPVQAKHYRVEPGTYAVLSVSDTGIGMDAETKAKVFEPFFTTKEVGKGTGLGLSTVYGIAQQSGGFVTLQSELGKGATFNIHLPAVAGAADVVETAVSEKTLTGTGKILLVEDEESLRHLAYRMLTEAGYTVIEMSGGHEAVKLSAADLQSFDLLLTDVIMPEMNGQDLARELLRRHPKLKVLFVSGYTNHPRIDAGDFPRDQLLHKPFSQTQLLTSVHNVMHGITRRDDVEEPQPPQEAGHL